MCCDVRREKTHVNKFVALHGLFCFFSLGGICSKMAAGAPVWSLPFLLYYGAVLMILFVYAIAWQRLIAVVPLSTAFAHRAVTVIWGVIWGMILFGETVRLDQLVGVLLIALGIVLYARADRRVHHA